MRILQPFGAVSAGGTGISSYTIGDMIYASGTTTLSKLAAVAVGQVLISGGVATAPAWSPNPSVSTLILRGSSSGTMTLTVPATVGTRTITLPAGTTDFSATGGTGQVVRQSSTGAAFTVGTLASTDLSNTANIPLLDAANVFSSATGQSVKKLLLPGSTSGTLTVLAAAIAGTTTLTLPGGTTDFSATGGTSQVVKQTSAGGAFTVAQLAASDLSNGTTGTGAVALATSPTFTTSLIAPLVLGGTGAGSSLTLQSTSGAGTTDLIDFKVGNNGAVTAATINTDGTIGIGTTTTTAGKVTIQGNSGTDYDPAANPANVALMLKNSTSGALNHVSLGLTTESNGEVYITAAENAGNDAADLTLLTRNAGARAERFRMTAAGLFGFGTTTPTNLLSLGGNTARTLWMERHSTADTAGNSLTLQSGGATSGATNKAAGALVLAAGLGTGNAIPAQVQLKGDNVLGTGTTDHTSLVRYVPNAYKVLTDASPTTILSLTVASGTSNGGVLDYMVEVVNDAADTQVEVGRVYFHANNQGGVITAVATETNSQQTLGAGTLATTWAASAANPSVVSINADSSLTPSTGYPRITFAYTALGNQAIT